MWAPCVGLLCAADVIGWCAYLLNQAEGLCRAQGLSWPGTQRVHGEGEPETGPSSPLEWELGRQSRPGSPPSLAQEALVDGPWTRGVWEHPPSLTSLVPWAWASPRDSREATLTTVTSRPEGGESPAGRALCFVRCFLIMEEASLP